MHPFQFKHSMLHISLFLLTIGLMLKDSILVNIDFHVHVGFMTPIQKRNAWNSELSHADGSFALEMLCIFRL